MQRQVQILGSGVAAAASARLLADCGIPFHHSPSSRSALGAILLGTQTQRLLHDIFQDAGFLAQSHSVHSRTVLWGESASATTVAHHGLVISEKLLLEHLWRLVPGQIEDPVIAVHQESSVFSICTAGRLGTPSHEFLFGRREAAVYEVSLREEADRHGCAIESISTGWLFLLPVSPGRATLISVSTGVSLQDQLAQSRLLDRWIDAVVPSGHALVFPCAPRLSSPLATEDWLYCGSAAMSFDPVCGEGAGHALREAFLAAAVVNSSKNGEPIEELTMHYSARLLAGFLRHLQLCRGYYATGGVDEFWRSELALLDAGIVQVKNLLSVMPPPSYRFHGLLLERLDNSAHEDAQAQSEIT